MSTVGTTPPSGSQYRISDGSAEATVTEVGATLRSYSVAGRHVLDGFAVTERAGDGRGQVLAPWPNRIHEGRYRYGGRDHQVPLNEPARNNAIHGLVRWADWRPLRHTGSSVSLACLVRPQPGYEWAVRLEVEYSLDRAGLTVGLRAVNVGSERAPFGAGFHPYLGFDGHRVDDLELTVPASERIVTGDDGTTWAEPVSGTTWDFRDGRRVGRSALDTAYGGLARGADGRAEVELVAPGGTRATRLWVDESFPYLMVYTGDKVHDAGRRRASVAVEPMTCPPQALRTGVDVVDLDPGETWGGRWGLQPRVAAD